MKIYLIGDATVINDQVLQLFEAAKTELEQVGNDVVNFHNISWYMENTKESIPQRLKQLFSCESVHVLPGWQSDPVAQLEMAAAVTASIPITYALGVSVPRKISFFTF